MSPTAPPPAPQNLLTDAIDLVRAAGRLTLTHFRTDGLVIERKGDGTPVTEADKGAERLIRAELASAYPDDAILGEEEGETPGSSGRRWIIDPIDGTKAFTHGVPLYSNLLCIEDEHGPLISVVNMPALDECVWAGRGLGAHCNGKPARVSDRTELAGGYLTTSGFDYWDAAMVGRAHGLGMRLRTWGDGYGYALVATGRVDAMVDPEAALWDLAPMPLLLAEAGGRFSSLEGDPSPGAGSGVATNGAIHDALLTQLRG